MFRDITVQEAVRSARLLVSHLKSLRTETMFNHSKGITEEPNFQETANYQNSGLLVHQYETAKDL